jgi:hypothetical protein
MTEVVKWMGKGLAALALPAATVALMAVGIYLTLVP